MAVVVTVGNGWLRSDCEAVGMVTQGITADPRQSTQISFDKGYRPDVERWLSFRLKNPGCRPHRLCGSAPGSLCRRRSQYRFSRSVRARAEWIQTWKLLGDVSMTMRPARHDPSGY